MDVSYGERPNLMAARMLLLALRRRTVETPSDTMQWPPCWIIALCTRIGRLGVNKRPGGHTDPAIVAAMKTQVTYFVCPSNPRRSGKLHSADITNYKAMGATTRGSLVMVVNPQATPPYGSMSQIPGTVPFHPDGAMFPGNGIRVIDIPDGLSHTIVTTEAGQTRPGSFANHPSMAPTSRLTSMGLVM